MYNANTRNKERGTYESDLLSFYNASVTQLADFYEEKYAENILAGGRQSAITLASWDTAENIINNELLLEDEMRYDANDNRTGYAPNTAIVSRATKLAIEQAGLKDDYIPDSLVLKLIQRYYDQNITEAGKVVENMMQSIHNINLYISQVNNILNEKLNGTLTAEELGNISPILDYFKKQAADIPSLLKKLEEAKQNLMYEKETEISRGGVQVLSSMRATDD